MKHLLQTTTALGHQPKRVAAFLLALMLMLWVPGAGISSAFAYDKPWDQGHDYTTPDDNPPPPGPCEGECESPPDPPPECDLTTGSPVMVSSGYLFLTETDVVLPGRPLLKHTRSYSSNDPRPAGWYFSCYESMYFDSGAPAINGTTGLRPSGFRRTFGNGKPYFYGEQKGNSWISSNSATPESIRFYTDASGKQWYRLDRPNGSYNLYDPETAGKIARRVDRNGNAIHYRYDGYRLSRQSDGHGRYLAYGYSSKGQLNTITDHSGRSWRYGYDDKGSLVSVTDPTGAVRHYRYDVVQTTETITIGNYLSGRPGPTYHRLTQIRNAAGITQMRVSYTKDSSNRVATYSDLANTYTYSYNSKNRTSVKTDSMGQRSVYQYDDRGQKTAVDIAGHKTLSVYDSKTNTLKEYTDQLGNKTSYTYNSYFNRLTETDARGTITYSYDAAKPWPLTITSRTGRTTTLAYDARGNPTRLTDPAGKTTAMQWSAEGDLLKTTDALGHTTSATYNAIGLPLTITDELGNIATIAYDAVGRPIKVTNGEGETQQYTYDALGRVLTETDGNGDTTRYTYDAAGKLLTVTAPNNSTVSYAYDNFGRLRQRTFYDGTETSYTYRKDNLVSAVKLADGNTITFAYDTAKRMIGRNVSSLGNFTYAYNALGQITRADGASQSVSFAYDAFGRLTREGSNTLGYNTEDEVTALNAAGLQHRYTYDNRGLLTTLNAGNTNPLKYDYSYDAIGKLTGLNRNTGINSSLAYDKSNQITQISNGSISNYHYQYDLAGRIIQWQGNAHETRTYSYDQASRITDVQSATNPEQFSYDNLGNRTSNNAQFDQANRITEDAIYRYRYDIRGNRTQKVHKNTGVVEQYSYNTLNQLVEYKKLARSTATTPQIHYTYLYDAMGRRVGKADKLNSTVTAFQWLGSQMVSEQTQGQSKTNYVLDGSLTPVAAMQDNAQYDFYKDHLGTVHSVTDSNGSNVWSGDYSTFGAITETDNGYKHNLRFAGQYHDRESGLYYNFYRDYDPSLGRYVQSDPIGLVAGLNTYAYVRGNPVAFSDHLGLYCTYSQSSGRITCTNESGIYYEETGYAGKDEGRNNPDRQGEVSLGPLPRGQWRMTGNWYNSPNTGLNTIVITPLPGNECFGTNRDCSSFRVHGNNSTNNASEGCIILPPSRTQIPTNEIIEVTR